MNIYLFGQGCIGKGIKENFLKNPKNNVSSLSLRETSIETFLNLLSEDKKNKIIIDLVDPNNLDNKTDVKLINKAINIREKLNLAKNLKHYIYLSTAKLYNPCLSVIDENSKIKNNFLSDYERMKFDNEAKLINAKLPLTICRLPNIWGVNSNQTSFFNDLFKAHREKNKINYFDNDHYVISYLNINDLVSLLGVIVTTQIYGVVNLSTNTFDSRYNLKAKVNCEKLESINNLKGIRLSSIKLDSSKYIGTTRIYI